MSNGKRQRYSIFNRRQFIMKLNLTNYGESNWYPYDPDDKDNDVELQIREYPAQRRKVGIQDEGTLILSGSSQLDEFTYCLQSWKNVVDENDKPIKCSHEVKQQIFNYGIDNFVARVTEVLLELREAKAEAVKN